VISVTDSKSTPSKLLFSDIRSGEGPQVEAGDLIEVQYVGALLDSGLEFDASWERGQSFFVLIGVGAVIQGWDQGILGMQSGSRRLLVIPPDLAYGEQGAGDAIGPDSSFAVVVDVLQIVEVSPPEFPGVEPLDNDSLLRVDEAIGTSVKAVEPGDTITVHYLGTLEDGTIFDASWRRGQPFTTQIGVGRVIPGWDQGMIGMKEGGRRLLHIPSDLAYGKNGSGSTIGPDTPLVFVVDLLRIHN
jgi:peptidylprolyl isomerase